MVFIDFSITLTVTMFSGLVFHVTCQDSRRQCFDVDSRTICYFMPNVSSVDWDTAWKTCKELDATLPVILNEKGQKLLGNYLSRDFPVQSVWAAGRYIGNSEWRWMNNQIVARTVDDPKCRNSDNRCIHETQAVLTKQREYEARYPKYDYNYICIFPAVNCTTESPKSISWKGGCFKWTTHHKLPLNKARNECLKGGGDLATFSENGDLHRLIQFPTFLNNSVNEYWVGLHRKWWIWNTTDIQAIKYNLLDDYGDVGKDCLFINESSKWNRDKCSVNKNVICRTETTERRSADSSFTASVAIGIVVAVLVVAITVVILLLFIKKRWCIVDTKPDAGTSTRKSDPVTPSQKAIVEYQDDTYATIEDNDLYNLSGKNGSSPSTSYTKGEFRYKSVSVYSEPADFDASEANRSTDVYSEPYGSSVVTPK